MLARLSLNTPSRRTLLLTAGLAIAGAAAILAYRRLRSTRRVRRRRHGKPRAKAAASKLEDADAMDKGLRCVVPRKYQEIASALQGHPEFSNYSMKQLAVLYDEFQRHSLQRASTQHTFRVDGPRRTERFLDREQFARIFANMGITDERVVNSVFRAWDQDGDNRISFAELLTALTLLTKGGQEEKMQFIFKCYDLDDDGLLTRKELHEIYRTSLAAAGEPHDEDSVKEMVNSLFSTMDTNGDSAISRDEFLKAARNPRFNLDFNILARFGESMAST